MQETFLDFCRQEYMPLNDADQLLYKMKASRDVFDVFKIWFDQIVDNGTPPDFKDVDIPGGLNKKQADEIREAAKKARDE